MTAIRQVQSCRASVMSSAVLWCTVMCLVQFVYVRCLSALQGLVRGHTHKKKISNALPSNWTWTSLFSRLTCNTRPLSFTINVYPTLPGRVCPHNPIIPDKIFHYLEYFQCRPAQSGSGSLQQQQQSALLSVGSSIHLQGEISRRGRFSPLVQMAGHSVKLWPVVVSKVWLQWRLWPISLYCSDVKHSHRRVKPQNVAREWMWLIHCHGFSSMNSSASQLFKMRRLQLCGNTARYRGLLYVTSVNPETSEAHMWPKHHEDSCQW